MVRESVRTTLTISSSQRDLVDELKRIIHVALLAKYFAYQVRVRKTSQKTARRNQYYVARITVDISVQVDDPQTKLF